MVAASSSWRGTQKVLRNLEHALTDEETEQEEGWR